MWLFADGYPDCTFVALVLEACSDTGADGLALFDVPVAFVFPLGGTFHPILFGVEPPDVCGGRCVVLVPPRLCDEALLLPLVLRPFVSAQINKSTITMIRLVLIFISVVVRFVSIELTRRSVKISNNRLTRTVCSRRVDVVLPVDL